ncbi:hypothetical protein GGI42DRAFT_296906 [Trichoderma sp. SZMC 28013]
MIYEIYMRYTCLLSQKNKRYPNYQLHCTHTGIQLHFKPRLPHALRRTYRARLSAPAPFFPGGEREGANKPKWPGPLFLFSSSPFPFFSNCALQAVGLCSVFSCRAQQELFERARVSPEIAVCEWAKGRHFTPAYYGVLLSCIFFCHAARRYLCLVLRVLE